METIRLYCETRESDRNRQKQKFLFVFLISETGVNRGTSKYYTCIFF